MKLLEVRKTAVYSSVNEDFEDEADAERALLDGFRYICFRKRATGIPNISRYLATVLRAMQ